MVPQLFIAKSRWCAPGISLEAEERHYLRNVLRLNSGDKVIISDGAGQKRWAVIRLLDKKSGILTPAKDLPPDKVESGLEVTLIQCLPRASKMDLIVQKATELGVTTISPIVSARSFKPADPKTGEKWFVRWHKIAEEAARQSGRRFIPRILPIATLDSWCAAANTPETVERSMDLVFWEEDRAESLRDIERSMGGLKKIRIMIGPEGGLAEHEVDHARSCGFRAVTLGHRILRTETAAIAAIAIVQYCWENMSGSQ